MVCSYHWIFLFISRSKIERNYCFGRLNQFDSCSTEQICTDYGKRINLIIFNETFCYYNSSLDIHELFIEESKKINFYYKPFYLRYSHLLSTHKIFSKIQMLSNTNEKINFAVVLTGKEKWNLFYKYYNLCEFDNYYIMFLIMISLGGAIGSLLFGFLSDIYGRRSTIRTTLWIITIISFLLATHGILLDHFYNKEINDFKKINRIKGEDYSYENIISLLYAQERMRGHFKKYFNLLVIDIFILSGSLWPLLKSCMALLIENSIGELNVLIGFRRYNLFFGGIPALFTYLIFVNVNNYTYTFLALNSINLILSILSSVF